MSLSRTASDNARTAVPSTINVRAVATRVSAKEKPEVPGFSLYANADTYVVSTYSRCP